jgi:cell division septation protein DedD
MQDLGRYTKKKHIRIHTKYLSFFAAGSVFIVGLVFTLGILVGSRHKLRVDCRPEDPLAALDSQSNEPAPPTNLKLPNLSFHESLLHDLERVPTPASLLSKKSERVRRQEHPMPKPTEPSKIKPALEEEPIPEKLKHDEVGYYSLQVGSFENQREAKKLVQMLTKAGHDSFLVSVNMPERGGRWYRVRVGPFSSKREVWNYKRAFETRERIPAFVVKRRIKS